MAPKRKNGAKKTTKKAEGTPESVFLEGLNGIQERFDAEFKEYIAESERESAHLLAVVHEYMEKVINALPKDMANMTMAELYAMDLESKAVEKTTTPENNATGGLENAIVEQVNHVLADIQNSTASLAKKKKIPTGTKPKKATHSTLHRSKSAQQSTHQRSTSAQQFITPAGKRIRCPTSTTSVTPKFDPKVPPLPSTRRKLRPGEIAMSLSGSPLNVEQHSEVVLSLGNGQVISASGGANLEEINSPVRNNLEQLYNQISTLLKKTKS